MRLESKEGATEVDCDSEVPQKVTPEDTALFEPRCFVDRAKVQNESSQIALLQVGYTAVANKQHRNVFGDAGSSDDARGLSLYYLIAQLQALDGSHRDHCRASARVEDSVEIAISLEFGLDADQAILRRSKGHDGHAGRSRIRKQAIIAPIKTHSRIFIIQLCQEVRQDR